MSKKPVMELKNTCAVCGAEESLDALIYRMINDDNARRLIAQVMTLSLPLGGMVVRYLRLHKPATQQLKMDKAAQLLAELVPDIQRQAIRRNGRTWAVGGPESWRLALEKVFDAAEKGKLDLPLTSNAYLYEVLMRMADKTEAAQEREYEASRARPPTAATVMVNGQGAMPIGAALQAVYGGRDPVLTKLDGDEKRAAPVPDQLRKQLARLKART